MRARTSFSTHVVSTMSSAPRGRSSICVVVRALMACSLRCRTAAAGRGLDARRDAAWLSMAEISAVGLALIGQGADLRAGRDDVRAMDPAPRRVHCGLSGARFGPPDPVGAGRADTLFRARPAVAGAAHQATPAIPVALIVGQRFNGLDAFTVFIAALVSLLHRHIRATRCPPCGR